VGRKVRCRIPGRKTCGPSRAAPRGGYRMTGRKALAERSRRKTGIGCGQQSGHASGLEAGASRTAGRVMVRKGVSQSRRTDDAARRARKRPPLLLLTAHRSNKNVMACLEPAIHDRALLRRLRRILRLQAVRMPFHPLQHQPHRFIVDRHHHLQRHQRIEHKHLQQRAVTQRRAGAGEAGH
jgi:hypothetical protein